MTNQLSDNFLRVAKEEVKEEIESVQKILSSCKNDSDISLNGNAIEKHMHKIKGLAPMMNQNDIGEISQMIDKILKHIIENGKLSGIYEILTESNYTMKQLLEGPPPKDVEEVKKRIKNTFPDIFV
ncbi:MAG: hypothetical protein ACE5JT_04545 [Nitrosopumilaceae archaeon]